MMTVFKCPMMLYDRLLSEPMTRNVERETRMPSSALITMAAMADGV